MENPFKALKIIVFSSLTILLIYFFDKGLSVGFLMLSVLIGGTFLLVKKKLVSDRFLFGALLITIFVHLAVVLFIYYANFQPFGGGEGDYATYNSQARYLAQNLRQGDFSGLGKEHLLEYGTSYYPVVIGLLYAITVPDMLVGQLFGIWLAVVSVLLIYLLVIEIGGTKMQAFFVVLFANAYPSYIFYGSLLLKDTLIIPFVVASLLLVIKLTKNFSWRKFLVFYLILIALTHFRFYISYAVIIAFFPCWLIFSNLDIKKRIKYGIIIVLLLGFLPQISGYGYFGIDTFRSYFSKEAIINYRQEVYRPDDAISVPTQPPTVPTQPPTSIELPEKGKGSTFKAATDFSNPISFSISYSETFAYVLFGPLPWQIKLNRQRFVLLETIPWYILFFFIIKGIIKSAKKYKIILPLLLFSITVIAVLGLYTPNFGVVTRIRMPGFMILFCFAPFGFDISNRYISMIKNYLNKKLAYDE